ncbi:hydroxyethylthiazole kinase [Pelotomaculum propionicicum]|uniref:Hydroxyethylthiazole kinase n=1 Tax=Pelotomaculum propionicicum TaxID=258475 RepID=A0A4Y7RM67_9FIRM|nr:hydroxyethylthiazole kinase [Pelotomaculum propionicicum]NLI12651.1 hydroxyethylthiazole kinase [Peptococcaceae bacterium]TEB09772.1 Hydroxyethylthiazole kinase [Pelotomaculum propionicicum]
MLSSIAGVLRSVREKTPLVQAITNYVTINDCANILLCFGASPAMCEAKTEVEDFTGLISSLYINIGTLTEEQKEAALLAARKASELNKPIVLDPVACCAIPRKMTIIKELFENAKISVIKGNTGEIKFLAGYAGKVRGVDSIDDGQGAVEACVSLARQYNTIVAATGETDIITDGERVCFIHNQTPMLTRITGAGCMVGALTAAAAGVTEDRFTSSAAALMAMSLAGEMAANSLEKQLPGTFRMRLFDCLHNLTEEDILNGGKISCL